MSKKTLVFGYLVLLAILHQDFWLKDNDSLVFGFLPATLAYHMGFVCAAGFGWYMVTKFAWPDGLEGEEVVEASEGGSSDS